MDGYVSSPNDGGILIGPPLEFCSVDRRHTVVLSYLSSSRIVVS
jgi:hypothetical protein